MTAKIPIEITSESADAQRDMDRLGKGLSQLDDAGQKANEGFKIVGLSLTDLKSAMDMAGKAVEVLKQVYEETVGAVLAYSDQVRDLGRISGATAEETSRLIQTADDLQVSYETLQAAAKALAKDGIALTTDELAKASDEYLAIEGAGARAEFATTRFGRAGLELTKILETGGAALREMASATDENLVMTEAQVKAARDLEIQMDNLEDSVTGVKLAVGNALVPALVDAIDKMMKFGNSIKTVVEVNEDIAKVMRLHNAEMVKGAKNYAEYRAEMERAAKVAGYNISVTGELTRTVMGANDAATQMAIGVNILTDYYKDMTDEGTRAATAARLYAREITASDQANKDVYAALTNTNLSLEDQERALNDAATASGVYRGSTEMTAKAVNDLVSKYGSLNDAQLYNILVQGMDGDAAIALGVKMGILSPAVMAARDAAEALNKKFQAGAIDAATYAGQAEALAAAIAKLQDKSITITTYYNNVGKPMTPEQQAAQNPNNPNGPGQTGGPPDIDRTGVIYRNAPIAPDNPINPEKYAQGGSYTIPAGHNEDWPVGPNAVASSGETVTITPPGKGGTETTYYLNLNFYGPTNTDQAKNGVLAGMRAAGKL